MTNPMTTSESQSIKWFKITNREENHHGFQYQDGLNVLTEPFNDNLYASCCTGGFYFSDAHNILRFIGYGCYLREIILPTNDPEFKMMKDLSGDKWRANKVIFGKKYDLGNVDTFKMLLQEGMLISDIDYSILRQIIIRGHMDVLKYLITNGAHVIDQSDAYLEASYNGHLEIIKYFVEIGFDINNHIQTLLYFAKKNGHLEIYNFITNYQKNENQVSEL